MVAKIVQSDKRNCLIQFNKFVYNVKKLLVKIILGKYRIVISDALI